MHKHFCGTFNVKGGDPQANTKFWKRRNLHASPAFGASWFAARRPAGAHYLIYNSRLSLSPPRRSRSAFFSKTKSDTRTQPR